MGKLLSEMILDLGKYPNPTVHESESAGALPEVKNHFRKQFSINSYIITVLIFFEAFCLYLKRKKLIFHCIFKNGFVQCQGLFLT